MQMGYLAPWHWTLPCFTRAITWDIIKTRTFYNGGIMAEDWFHTPYWRVWQVGRLFGVSTTTIRHWAVKPSAPFDIAAYQPGMRANIWYFTRDSALATFKRQLTGVDDPHALAEAICKGEDEWLPSSITGRIFGCAGFTIQHWTQSPRHKLVSLIGLGGETAVGVLRISRLSAVTLLARCLPAGYDAATLAENMIRRKDRYVSTRQASRLIGVPYKRMRLIPQDVLPHICLLNAGLGERRYPKSEISRFIARK